MQLSEHAAYNALAILRESAYAELRDLKQRHGVWAAALENEGYDPLFLEKEWSRLETEGVRLILKEDPDYPSLLREIPHSPHALYIKGSFPPPESTAVAIVGTRRATPTGKETTRIFARELARRGIAVISGLAFGIDAAAHTGTLEGNCPTFAVLACGLDAVYPASHRHLAEKICAKGGSLISEYPPGSPALPYRFLERNRIVSGLSRAVLVIEAPERSGAIATARFALEQNRDIFVLPGPAAHPNFKGSHTLIRQGAMLVTNPEELLADLGFGSDAGTDENAELSGEEALIRAALRSAARALTVDEIIEVTMLEPRIANQNIATLVLRNLIREEGSGYAM